ncbi:diacylglycerol acyltransferase-domain-containing protein [Catenaria anguillulae PL171]|uniref:Diacylglycerol O-acyltransferase n=1 Tax=Catenaria anguillulae PL171 TaxID=765915 RepID=A0A1Y2HCM7_9FUNG|nr:diacylglycerol acyltransferase-domain-containing protein [Catenaria anguillulae PL171]
MTTSTTSAKHYPPHEPTVPPAASVAGIKIAPVLSIPLQRRLQTLGTLLWLLLLPTSIVLTLVLLYLPSTRIAMVAYIIWVLYWDTAPETGGRKWGWVRNWVMWKWMAAYFPIEIRKEGELDPSRNYLMGYHPHGVVSIGAWINIGTEATGFSSIFPGINLRLLTLVSNFNIFLFRDIILWLGVAGVSRRSIENIFAHGPGHSAAIVVGGAQECLYAKPGTMDLVLKKRLGFIKVAVLNKALLVPIMSFGENEAFDLIVTHPGSFGWKVQQWCKSVWGWTMPAFNARGVFNYSVGLLPHRQRIVTVFNKPVDPEEVVGRKFDPKELSSDELQAIVQQVHAAYVKRLTDCWDKYKDELCPNRVKELDMVE